MSRRKGGKKGFCTKGKGGKNVSRLNQIRKEEAKRRKRRRRREEERRKGGGEERGYTKERAG